MGYHTETRSLPPSANVLFPFCAAMMANRVLLFKSCISALHLSKATSVLYISISPFPQSSPKQSLYSRSHTVPTEPCCKFSSSLPSDGVHDLSQPPGIRKEYAR